MGDDERIGTSDAPERTAEKTCRPPEGLVQDEDVLTAELRFVVA